jgi:hypothetical protein
LQVDFEVEDALARLIDDGIVTETADGYLVAKQPKEAALHIDAMWDEILNMLPDNGHVTRAGREVERGSEISTASRVVIE